MRCLVGRGIVFSCNNVRKRRRLPSLYKYVGSIGFVAVAVAPQLARDMLEFLLSTASYHHEPPSLHRTPAPWRSNNDQIINVPRHLFLLADLTVS